MRQAVLHELHAGEIFGQVVHVGFLHLDLELLGELVLGQLPAQTVQRLLPFLLDLLVGELFVGGLEPAFEERLGELHLLHFLHHGGLGVHAELVFGVLVHAAFEFGFHFLAELLLALHGTLAVHFVEELLVDLGRDDLRGFGLFLLLALFSLSIRRFLLCLLHLSVAVGVGVDLLLNHFVGHLYVVVRELVAGGQFAVELGCEGDVEHEREGVHVVEIDLRSLLLVGERLAQDIEFFLTDVVIQLLADHFVNHLCEHGFAVHFLDKACGYFARAEAGNVSLLTKSANLFVHLFCVVCGLHHEGDFRHQVLRFCS